MNEQVTAQNKESKYAFLTRFGIMTKFTLGIITSLLVTSVITAIFVLNQQSNALNNIMDTSHTAMQGMFAQSLTDSKEAQTKKVENLANLLASIAPGPMADFEMSTLNNYAQVSKKDADISYIAFLNNDGIIVGLAGNKTQIKKGSHLIRKISTEGVELGSVVVGYNFDRLNEKLLKKEALNKEKEQLMVASRESEINSAAIKLSIAMLISAATTVFILIYMFRYLVSRRLTILEHNMRDIAEGDGDLRQRVTINGKDAIDRVGHYFNLFLDKIHSAITRVDSAAHQISHSASQMSTVTNETTDAVSAQQSETEQVATAINQMAATVTEVARSATEAANAAQQADNESNDGKAVVLSSIEFIGKLADDVENAATVINQLKSDSESIGSVLDVIKGIAEQTNLLALNAAIEAARAGEQGRGFAVVADEVRSLAQRTKDSTTEIQAMIEKLQTGAEKAVHVMEAGREQAQLSVDKANETGSSLEAITTAVKTISQMNAQIASAAEEQNSVAEEINKNIVKISEHGNQTASGANQTSIASTELSALSTELSSLMTQFKI